MARISKNELSRAKKRAEKTAQALGKDLDQELYEFYEEYSDSKYDEILEQAIAANTDPKQSTQQPSHKNQSNGEHKHGEHGKTNGQGA